MNLSELIKQASEALAQSGSRHSRLEAELLIAHFSGIDRLELMLFKFITLYLS